MPRRNLPFKAVIFDWAGTMVDFGSLAPVMALEQAFEQAGVPITRAEARLHMGRSKREHIAAILALPRVSAAWQSAWGHAPQATDGDRLFNTLGPIIDQVAAARARLIPGAAETVTWLRAQGVAVGSTTGYSRAMMDVIIRAAADQGYAPDSIVCADDVPCGRPAPFLIYRSMTELAVWPAGDCVVVDDSEVGIMAARAAGCWTVGVTASGNATGLDEEAFHALNDKDRQVLVTQAEHTLLSVGAHEVVQTISGLETALATLAEKMRRGEKATG